MTRPGCLDHDMSWGPRYIVGNAPTDDEQREAIRLCNTSEKNKTGRLESI
jgi:hypothetical protein